MKPKLLVLIYLADHHQALVGSEFDFIYAPDAASRAKHIAEDGAAVRAVLTNGTTGLTAAEIDAMPALGLACALGVGFENIDVAHCKSRGVAVANGAGTNDDCVADHAMALLLAAVRNLRWLDQQCRAGVWRDKVSMPPNVSHRRIGIVGLGDIGRKVAKRALGFDMEVGYHGRTKKDVPHTYFADVKSLAAWADFLVVATPGGAATRHMVNAEVLTALGPQGYLVNIARGSVVDTQALADALREGRVGGAGLDVYESEPKPPAVLMGFDNVVLTPHLGGWSPEAMQASVQRFVDNATRHFAGQAMVSPL
ncbi:MAG: hydroxyacid dehydrogenase [Rhodoferax sp.]|nr:hydroxyacid dehydrogenase [Rhodoferax sp.]